MRILVVAEHDGTALRAASRSALGFSRSLAEPIGGTIECLVLGSQVGQVAVEASAYVPVLVADSPALVDPLADRYAPVIAQVVADRKADLVVAASTTGSKDIVSRAAGLLGGCMASDVVAHQRTGDELVFRRPMFAGSLMATVALKGSPKIVTVRPSACAPASVATAPCEVTHISVDEPALPGTTQFLSRRSKQTDRPELTEARVIVSGGRAIKNADDFERLVGGLADKLDGATGSSRALVDAGIAPNEMQVGQTGKVVAPDLYIALGLSGAVQHWAGMKDSKTIVAINSDPEAPIFELADYGVVGDVYEVVPQLIEKLL